MDRKRHVIWDANNSRHLLVDHQERAISKEDIQFALETAMADDHEWDDRHGTVVTVGKSPSGRRLVVAWVSHQDGGCYPVHARWAGRKTNRRLRS